MELAMSIPNVVRDPTSISASQTLRITSGGRRYEIAETENTTLPAEHWKMKLCGQGAGGSLICGQYSVRGRILVRPDAGHAGKISAAVIREIDAPSNKSGTGNQR